MNNLLKTRVIPTLLSDGFGLVKGEGFHSWRTVGTITQAVRVFNRRDVDELMILDVAARREGRGCDPNIVEDAAATVRVPLTIGGGISTVDDVERLLASGADKVVLNTAAHENPVLIEEVAGRFGSQCVVVSIDASASGGIYSCVSHSGSRILDCDPVLWAKECVERGAGEVLVTRVEYDGTMRGYDLELIGSIAAVVSAPVIASGGAGSYSDLVRAVTVAGASAVAAGAMFQFTEQTPAEARMALARSGVAVRAMARNAE